MLTSAGHWAYQPLSAEHVRWYWLKPNFDAKTAVKSVQPDMPHRADILRFCDADNAVLEAGYQCVLPATRQRQAQQLTHAPRSVCSLYQAHLRLQCMWARRDGKVSAPFTSARLHGLDEAPEHAHCCQVASFCRTRARASPPQSMAAAESRCAHGAVRCGRERRDELEAAWWQEHAELALGPSAAAAGAAGPAGGSPTKGSGGGADGNMTYRVAHVAAKKQQLLDREVTATSWRVRL